MKPYDSTTIIDLRERTEYESWLIEAVYEVTDQSLLIKSVDQLIYPPGGALPTYTIYGVVNINLGDWRPGFLDAGAPLVFITNFKLLDMLIEWVLVNNGHPSTHRFQQKIAALKGSVKFPPLIETLPWLRERLIALYENLEPLRGTVIHARHFKTQKGSLNISSSKGGKIGTAVTLTPTDLRNLSLILVSLLRYLEGIWIIDLFGEKRIRRALDELIHLHQLPSLGQLPPGFMTVRIYVKDEETIQYDMSRIYRDVALNRPGQDVIFDLRIIVISLDGAHANAYLIPWQQLQLCGSSFCKKRDDLAPYAVTLPSELDAVEIARIAKLLSGNNL